MSALDICLDLVTNCFVYFQGILGGNWGLSTAVGLFKGIVGTTILAPSSR